MTNYPDDLTDAQRDDAADLLEVVKRNQATAHKALRPGMPELFLLLGAQALGRLADFSNESSFGKVFLVIAILSYPGSIISTARQRRNLGAPMGLPTWLISAALALASLVMALTLTGDTKDDALAYALGGAVCLVAFIKHGALLVLLAGVIAIAGVTQSVSNWIQIPLVLVWVAIVAFVGRKELFNR